MRDAVFRMLFELVKDMEDPFSERLIVLGFSNILSFSIESGALSSIIQTNLMAMFQQVIREIVLIEEESNNGNGDDEEDDEDEEEEDHGRGFGAMMQSSRRLADSRQFLDDDEDVTESSSHSRRKQDATKSKTPDGGFDEEEDAVNEDDLDYLKLLAKLEKQDRVKAELQRANGNICTMLF